MPSRSAKWLRRPLELPASSTSTGGASSSRPPLRSGSICCGATRSSSGRQPMRACSRPASTIRSPMRGAGAPGASTRKACWPTPPSSGSAASATMSRGGLRALRVHVHVGAKEHGFGRAGQGGAQIDEGHALRLQRPLPVVQHASHGLRGGQAAKPVGLDARFVGHRDHQQLHLPLTQLIGPVPHQAHALVEHMHAGPGAQAVAVEQPAGAAHGDLVAQVSQQAIAQRCVPGIERVLRGQAQRAVQRAAGRAVQPGRRRHVGRLEAGVGQSPDAPTQAEREQQAGDDGVAAMPGGLRLVR